MDPLIELCSGVITDSSVINLQYYQVGELEFDLQPLNIDEYSTQLTNIKDDVGELDNAYNINLIRDLVDGINLPKTYNRAENKLLNMLLICKWLVEPVSSRVTEGYILGELYHSNNQRPLRVYDCAAGPGGWSSWILAHYPNSEVVGFTLKGDDPNFYWYPHLMSHPRFHGYYGDLLVEWRSHTDMIKNSIFKDNGGADLYMSDGAWRYENMMKRAQQESTTSTNSDNSNEDGADLYMSDGGLSYEMLRPGEVYDRSIEHRKVVASGRMRLILAQILAALNVTAVNGSIIIKLFNVDHPVLHQLLTVIGSCCQYSTIVKLVTSRSQNREAFYIGLYRKSDVSREISILSDILDRWEMLYPMRIVTEIPTLTRQFFDYVVNVELENHLQAVDMSNRLLEFLMESGYIHGEENMNKRVIMKKNLNNFHIYPGMDRYMLYSIMGIMSRFMM